MRLLTAAVLVTLGSASAFAAPPAVFNWTGFYVGGHVGGAAEQGRLSNFPNGSGFGIPFPTVIPTPDVLLRSDGVIGGGQVGFNWQLPSSWVAGVEGDISHYGHTGTGSFSIAAFPFGGPAGTVEFQTDLFVTARARLGYAAGNLLFYGTGGAAWSKEKLNTSGTTCGFFLCGTFASSDSQWVSGWAAGGGADYAFAPNWFVRLEYLRLDFGKKNFAVDPSFGPTLPLFSRVDLVRFALNYKFGN